MIPNVLWRTSTRSASNAGQCVEVGPYVDHSGRIAVRDSKNRAGAVLTAAGAEWVGFVSGLRAGMFDA